MLDDSVVHCNALRSQKGVFAINNIDPVWCTGANFASPPVDVPKIVLHSVCAHADFVRIASSCYPLCAFLILPSSLSTHSMRLLLDRDEDHRGGQGIKNVALGKEEKDGGGWAKDEANALIKWETQRINEVGALKEEADGNWLELEEGTGRRAFPAVYQQQNCWSAWTTRKTEWDDHAFIQLSLPWHDFSGRIGRGERSQQVQNRWEEAQENVLIR